MQVRYSIIVPVYNGENYLDRCISSVLAQKNEDWELLLIDDGSTDSSGLRIDGWAQKDSRIRSIHQPNSGQLFARRTGIDRSKGEYLLFLDCDDCWESNCLSRLDEVIAKDRPDMVLFAGQIYKNGENSGRIIGRISDSLSIVTPVQLQQRLLWTHDLNSLCLKAFQRRLFEHDAEDYSGFTPRSCGEDKAQLLFPTSRAKRIVYIPDVLYQYHHRAEGVMHSISLSTAEQMLANEMFNMLYRYASLWGMNDRKSRDKLDAYYLRNFLSVYYGIRKGTRTQQERNSLRNYPWRDVVNRRAFHLSAICLLNVKDQARLLAVALRL